MTEIMIVALAFATLALLSAATGNLLYRQGWKHVGNTHRRHADLARIRRDHERAGEQDELAEVCARKAWPYKVDGPSIEVPGGLVRFDGKLTDEEFAEFARRWRERHAGVEGAERVYPTIGTETTTETGMFWQQLRARLTRLTNRSGKEQ